MEQSGWSHVPVSYTHLDVYKRQALDSDTSIQVMDLLREVARDRLVVMVTHNPELAEKYATRIVNLRDGRIRSRCV